MKRMQRMILLSLAIFSVLLFRFGMSGAGTEENKQDLAEIREKIAGKENEPAEKVFQNIQILKGHPASQLPGMMSALTGLLGVDCSHCHIRGHWDSEEKPEKRTARQHFAMQAKINEEYFGGEEKLSCWTCHHGKPEPESLPPDSK